MLVAKLEQLSQLKRQLQKEQKVMDEMESQRASPNATAPFFNKHRLPLSSENDVFLHSNLSLHMPLTNPAVVEGRLHWHAKPASNSERHQKAFGAGKL
jgi:hypothetical protein